MARKCEIAVYGLGVMGSSLAKNMISHGFSVAVYSKDPGERERFRAEQNDAQVCSTAKEMLEHLKSPRCVFLMITAGAPVDAVLEEMEWYLKPGDVILDGGNSYYRDTRRRYEWCRQRKICYVGVGVSGGEQGALHGPSMMAGGSLEGWEKTRHILQTIAAHVGERPCCAYMGSGGAGHYVKMVHNGIEYGILQLLSETWYFMKHALCMNDAEIADCFESWKKGKLDSYLLDISIQVLHKRDGGGGLLVDKILDVAGQKGTGKWTVLEGIERGVYLPTIYEAVSARVFSEKKRLRSAGKKVLESSGKGIHMEKPAKVMGDALLLGILLCYSQGLELIVRAAEEEQWELDLEELLHVWENGCIIRSRLLGEICQARVTEGQPLLLDEIFAYRTELEPALREVNEKAVASGVALPGMASALHYYDYYRMEQMPVNFIQALRDCFGAHTYQRVDMPGTFHSRWEETEN